MRFVVISARSALGSSRFSAQRVWFVSISARTPAVRRFLRVSRTFRFALARSEFASGEHAGVVSAPVHRRWVSFTRRVVARK